MLKHTLALFALTSIVALSGPAGACSPTYIGDRSADPERETYGYLVTYGHPRPLGIVGPARNFGAVSGDDERDTIAFRPLVEITQTFGSLWIDPAAHD